MLEPDPKNHKEALRNVRLAQFWIQAAEKEMSGLKDRGCFKKHFIKDLTAEQRKLVFGSRFHHKIKRNALTGQVKSFKVRLVVMGNNMEKGEDYVDAFAPVPRATAARILLSIAAAEEMPQVFIRPPPGWPEEPGVVYEVLLSRFEGTDEGEVKEYLGCSIDRDRESVILGDDDETRLGVCFRRALEVCPGSWRSSQCADECRRLESSSRMGG